MEPSAASPYLGKVVAGRYRLDRLIGQGTFAWVFHARTIDDSGRDVAVKVLHSTEPTAGIRFAREVQVLRSLPPHPAVVAFIDQGRTADGWPILVLEYVDGITLQVGMERAQRLAPDKALAFETELCEAFVELHRLGVAHRDVKPENILLARSGGIKLIDFGLIRDAQGLLKLLEEEDPLESRIFADELDLNFLVGTPEYMAPEQFSDAAVAESADVRTDTWSDVFSLGVILYQLLSGEKPYPMRVVPPEQYPQEMLDYMQWRISANDDDLKSCPAIDEALDSIIRKALRQDPRQRQPDASALLTDLRRYQQTGRGIIQSDESHTHVVSLKAIMAAYEQKSSSPAPLAPSGSYRQLQPIVDDNVMSSVDVDVSDAFETPHRKLHSLLNDDSESASHTVLFFDDKPEPPIDAQLSGLSPLPYTENTPSALEPLPRGASPLPSHSSDFVPAETASSAAPPEPWNPTSTQDEQQDIVSTEPASSAAPPEPWASPTSALNKPTAPSTEQPWGSSAPQDLFAQSADNPAAVEEPPLERSWGSAVPPNPWGPYDQALEAPVSAHFPSSSPVFDPRLESPLPPEPLDGPSTDALVRASQMAALQAGSALPADPWAGEATDPLEESLEQWANEGPPNVEEQWNSRVEESPAGADHQLFDEADDDPTAHDASTRRVHVVDLARRPVKEVTRQVDMRRLVPEEFQDRNKK